MPKVLNVKGSGERKCKCKSWINHWENHTNKPRPERCSAKGCFDTDIVGAHVRYSDKNKPNHHHIIPLCRSHNNSVVEIDVLENTVFISANVYNTCR